MKAAPWNSNEIDSGIALYLTFRVLTERKAPFVKAQFIREIIGAPTPANPEGNPDAALAARSRGSVEAKFMNITAALEDIGRADLSMNNHGYRPLANYQTALKLRVSELVKNETLDSLSATIGRIADQELTA